jgi:hypothetical protein
MKCKESIPRIARLNDASETRVPPGSKRYRVFNIVPKRDFGRTGFLIDGKKVTKGWIVTDGFCNKMPGATWFTTVAKAKNAIDLLIAVDGDADMFWELMQPFKITPGDTAEKHGMSKESASIRKGRHFARFENGICVEVGILAKPVVG